MFEALYVHIPFCKERCAYCDFCTESLPQESKKMDDYLEKLILAIRAHTRAGDLSSIKTIYLGGGTPTHFGHRRLVELAYTLSLSMMLEQVEEYTLEANPESLSSELVRDMYSLGVNRLSLGVQSFVNEELAALGRIHTQEQAVDAFAKARERFENISIDLMCGIPGQSAKTWQQSLERALLLDPEHISVYPLQLEEGTLLKRKVEDGSLVVANEDEQAGFLEQASCVLEAAGYYRYEVASYAKVGKESKHNCAYWLGKDYLGLGTGAASMRNLEDGSRERWINGEEVEHLNSRERVAEDLMLAMRRSRGVSKEELALAQAVLAEAAQVFEQLQELGLVELKEDSYCPSAKGWLLGNELYSRVWDLANEA